MLASVKIVVVELVFLITLTELCEGNGISLNYGSYNIPELFLILRLVSLLWTEVIGISC